MADRDGLALLWDIDGTLLTTGRAGVFALEEAARDTLGAGVDMDDLATAGLTDVEIAMAIIRSAGRSPETVLVNRFLRAYENHLPAALPRKQGRVLPGVQEILEGLADRTDVLSLLLTGNTRAGAWAKLDHYGLRRFFTDGAFADDTRDRPAIARRALDMVRQSRADISPDRVYVIGDTPHDILCGRAIGARTIAVASGVYSEEELRAHDPWWALPVLPASRDFFGRVVRGNTKIKRRPSKRIPSR